MNDTENHVSPPTAISDPPRDFEALREHIAATRSDLPKRLAQAARHALAHPDDFALGTAASIASASGVQPSTLVRLARHLGYDGFSDFQSVFLDRLKSRASTYEERLARLKNGAEEGSQEGAFLNGFLSAARQSIDSLASAIDPGQFERCVNILAKADTIFIVAKRRAYPLAAHMAYGFGKLNIRSVVVETANGTDPELVQMATSEDAAIVCSFTPYAPASIELAQTLSAKGVPLVAVTDSALSPLTAHTTSWLEVSESDFGGFRSLSAGIALATALPVAVAERRRFHDGQAEA